MFPEKGILNIRIIQTEERWLFVGDSDNIGNKKRGKTVKYKKKNILMTF